MNESDLRRIVARFTEGRTLKIFGEPRVNVLLLNLALDNEQTAKADMKKEDDQLRIGEL